MFRKGDTYRSRPKELTESMVAAFIEAVSTLGTINREPEYFEQEKGLYAYLILKPIKRIAELLTADRELLVLFSSFTEQQPRTISVATNLIEKSSARLERNIVIIVHCDTKGNARLKNWGNDEDISVLPLHYDKGLPKGDAIENLLLFEMYSHDVFNVMGPVSDDARFYGRRSEALDIARQLQVGQVRSCLGIRKIGKTSVMNRVIDITTAACSCCNIMIDCSRDVVWQMNDASLLAAIADAIMVAGRNPAKCISISSCHVETSISEASEALLAAVRASSVPVILYFDEVDYITPGSPVSEFWIVSFNPFWRNLRAVYQEAVRNGVRFSIYVCGVSSKWFNVESINGQENAALSFIPEEYLGPLQLGASASMIKSLARTAGLVFESKISEEVAEVCSNVPFWIRKACSFIHRNIPIDKRPYILSADEVGSLLSAFVEREGSQIAGVALSHLFRVYPELEKPAKRVLANDAASVPVMLCNTLEKYGIVKKRASSIQISGEMMDKGMRLLIEKTKEERSPEQSPLIYSSMQEWAEDLALIGSGRNKLERKLRGAVLNFIRFDQLSKSGSGKVYDRVSKVLTVAKREAYKHLSLEELLEKYNWSELIQLVEREWVLFSKLFNDKGKFRLNAETVNKRYDAHAKDATKGDIALYNQSLDWFNDCLDRI